MAERITITIDRELLKYLDEIISSKIFASRSHALDFLVKRRIDLENEAKDYGYIR
jgi:metal-responsive CopG/Arc/MetJ family transcriptional regulator